MTRSSYRVESIDERPGHSDLPSARRFPRPTAAIIRLLVVLVATVGVISYSLMSRSNDSQPPARVPAASAAPSTTPIPSPAIADRPTDASLLAPGIDNRGFIDREGARCAEPQTAAAIGRTERSLVVICINENGNYEYRGIRLSDGAALQLTDVMVTSGGFLATNEDVAYAFSPEELIVTSGDVVVARDPMVEYFDPRLAPAASPAKPQPPTVTPPDPIVPSSVEYPSLPVNVQGIGDSTVSFTATGLWQFDYAVQCPRDAAVSGFFAAGPPKAVPYRFHDLRGDSSSRREGTSRRKVDTGPMVLAVNLFDEDCVWKVTIRG